MQIKRARTRKETTKKKSEQSRIEETVQQRLHESGYAQLWNVACRCCAGRAILTGHVPSFYMKQIAQTIVRQVDGVEQVDNLLEVETQDAQQKAPCS